MRINSSSKAVRPVDQPDLIDRVLQNVKEIKRGISVDDTRKPSNSLTDVVSDVVSSSPFAPPKAPPKIARGSIFSRSTTRKKDDRQTIGAMELENAITSALTNVVPGCEGFGGVFVRSISPKSRFDTNWTLRGVRFGIADREKANEALVNIVARMQTEFKLSDK